MFCTNLKSGKPGSDIMTLSQTSKISWAQLSQNLIRTFQPALKLNRESPKHKWHVRTKWLSPAWLCSESAMLHYRGGQTFAFACILFYKDWVEFDLPELLPTMSWKQAQFKRQHQYKTAHHSILFPFSWSSQRVCPPSLFLDFYQNFHWLLINL